MKKIIIGIVFIFLLISCNGNVDNSVSGTNNSYNWDEDKLLRNSSDYWCLSNSEYLIKNKLNKKCSERIFCSNMFGKCPDGSFCDRTNVKGKHGDGYCKSLKSETYLIK